jgi:carbon storage regulator CsrA
MLVLSRRLNEEIFFPGIGTVIEVVAIEGGKVRLGITGPPEVKVLREELLDPVETAPLPDQPRKAALRGKARPGLNK